MTQKVSNAVYANAMFEVYNVNGMPYRIIIRESLLTLLTTCSSSKTPVSDDKIPMREALVYFLQIFRQKHVGGCTPQRKTFESSLHRAWDNLS